MAEINSPPRIQESRGPKEDDDAYEVNIMSTPDVHNVALKIQRAKEVYNTYGEIEDKPTKSEVMVWYLYGLCSYFVHTVLIPIVFPLIISQTVHDPFQPAQGWFKSYKGVQCSQFETKLYEALVQKAIKLNHHLNFSPLQWTSISWASGLILSAPILVFVSIHLDHGRNQQLLAGLATAVGALFCLPSGFIRKAWIFPPYIAFIIASSTIVVAFHARHLGLMIRGFTGSKIRTRQFSDRRSFSSWLSLYSTAFGCLGAAIMASFTFQMLRRSDQFDALWVVSIFSGLLWGLGMAHIFSTNRVLASSSIDESLDNSSSISHVLSIFKYPHASGSLFGVFLSAFTTMSVFGGGLLYAAGYLCLERQNVLYLLLVYFLFPLVSLPLSHPLQQFMKLDAEKMQLLGFLLSCFTSGFGYYYRENSWSKTQMFLFAAVQGTATGLVHAFGRVLWLDCSPSGKEGAFSVWFSWARALGACLGFALSTSMPGNIGKSFGISFFAGLTGVIVVIFGNISSLKGAKDAGHVLNSEKASPVHEVCDDDRSGEHHLKGSVTVDVVSSREC